MINIEKLKFGYKKNELFEDVNLTLQPGNIYGLLGLNGAGKSSLLRLTSGLLFPDNGNLKVLGHNPISREPSFLSKIFVLPETVIVPNVTDKQYISIRAPFYKNFDHQHMQHCLKEFEVPLGRTLNTLSHGQQKKFLLAFGLACRPELLMLDEPTNGLDIPSKALFRRLVAESLTDDQIFIVSTHQIHDIESLIDSIVILHDGKVLFNKDTGNVSQNLRMSISNTKPENDNSLLYTEQKIGGYASLWNDNKAPDGQIDLELLFKAVVANPTIYSTLFNEVA